MACVKCYVGASAKDPRFPTAEVKEYLSSRGFQCVSNPYTTAITEDQLIELINDVDGSLASGERYTAKVFESLPKLKVVARVGVGYDAVDVRAATENGVVVTTSPVHELAQAMAEHTMALLLTFMHKIPNMNADIRQGEWRTAHWGGKMQDLYGLTLGLFGVGRIGSETAKRASSFDMKLIYHDVVRREDLEKSLGMEYVSFDRLIAESDVLSIHSPLTPQTRGIIDEQVINRMKPTAVLINTARGAIVDEAALVRALEQGRIAGACIDAYSIEPLAAPNPLYRLQDRLPNLILTPHTGYGPRTGRRMMYFAAEQMIDALEGRTPESVLNPEVLSHRRV